MKPAPKQADNAAGASAGGFELRELRQLIRLVQRTGIGELELASGGRSVRISAVSSAPVHAPAAAAPVAPPAEAAPAAAAPGAGAAASAPASNLKAITSPMVGTFYRASSPTAKPFAEVGDKVSEDTVLCIIEAMKLMNEIKAETRGTIRKILVQNAQPVEYGQPLFLIDPG